ncbi:MAG: NAD(P)-binding domain-containing protein [Bacteroidota bacterium]
MKKIGIIGSGMVGKVLASGFIKYGYEVMIGTSDVSKLNDWKSKEAKGIVGSMEEAAAFGDLIVLAVKGSAAEKVLNLIQNNINGKTIIDTTNPISETAPPKNGVLQYFTSMNESLMEILQKKFPSANFVKSFNSVGNTFMVDPKFPDGKPTMFICGNNADARKEVTAILEQFGWETCDMGTAEAAGPIESLCALWCIPGFINNNWMHAFKLMKM